jgi:hypothetical protein
MVSCDSTPADSPPKGQGDVVGVRETPLTEAGRYQTTRIRCCPDVPKIRVAGAIQHSQAIGGVRNLRLGIVNVASVVVLRDFDT